LLASPLGLAWRLQRGLLIGWSAGFALLGLIYGSVAESVGQLLEDSPQMADIFARIGGPGVLIDAYIAGVMGILALIAAAYGIQSTLRMTAEEETLRAELVLTGAVSRSRFLGSHLVFGFLGPAAVMLVAGVTMGLSYGLIAGDVGGQLPRVVGAGMVHLPAVWVMVGVVAVLFGVLPRLTSWSWGLFGAVVVVGVLGAILQLSQWIIDLSPFTHVPAVPSRQLVVQPLAWLLGMVVAMAITSFAGFRRRDLI
jgi:ABC-2 type transport system permease protein